MYVCICNAVTEDAVHECLAAGAQTTRQVKESCGMKPACGTCTKRIRTMVSQWQTASELADALTGGPATLQPVPGPHAEPAPARPEAPRAPRREVKQPAA